MKTELELEVILTLKTTEVAIVELSKKLAKENNGIHSDGGPVKVQSQLHSSCVA
jgi:hypothetical protein